MKKLIFFITILLCLTAKSQHLNFNNLNYFTVPEKNNDLGHGYSIGGYQFFVVNALSRIIIEKVDIAAKSRALLFAYDAEFVDLRIDFHGVKDQYFWFVELNRLDSSKKAELHLLEVIDDNVNHQRFDLPSKSFAYALMSAHNDSPFFHTFGRNGNKFFLHTEYVNTNEQTLKNLKTQEIKTLLPEIRSFARAAQTNDILQIAVSDGFNDRFEYLRIDLERRSISQNIAPFTYHPTDGFSLLDFSGDGLSTENGFINSQRYIKISNNECKPILSGYDNTGKRWIYSDESNRRNQDSLSNNCLNMLNGQIGRLPNGDIIATWESYETLAGYNNSLQGWQRVIVKIYTNEYIPKTKEAYIIELPDGFFPALLTNQSDGSLLISGNATNGSIDNLVNAYVHIPLSTVGINQHNKPNERLKFSLNDSHSLLRIHHQDVKNLEIFDEWGRQVAQSNEQSIDIAHLAQGLYIVRTKTQNGQSRQANFLKE